MVERRTREPLVALDLFANRAFSGANLMTFMAYGALGALLFVLVLHLQISAGYGALAAGISTLPITVVLLLLSARSGALAARIGPRLQMTVGPLLCAVGLLLTLRIDAHHRYYVTYVLPGIVVFALGLATFVAPLTATVMGTAPAGRGRRRVRHQQRGSSGGVPAGRCGPAAVGRPARRGLPPGAGDGARLPCRHDQLRGAPGRRVADRSADREQSGTVG